MAIIAPNIIRTVVEQRYAGQDVLNIWDWYADVEDVRVAATAICARMIDGYEDEVIPLQTNQLEYLGIRWVDMSAADGEVGVVSESAENSWPTAGATTQSGLPGNAAVIIRKVVTRRGRNQRSGSLRLGGGTEQWTQAATPNSLTGDVVGVLSSAFTAVMTHVHEGFPEGNVAAAMIHTVDGNFVGHSFIQAMVAQSRLGTQRRRMPGYGT